jgi:hypothetical protein
MSALAISLAALPASLVALAGHARLQLPEHHLSPDSKDIEASIGTIATWLLLSRPDDRLGKGFFRYDE